MYRVNVEFKAAEKSNDFYGDAESVYMSSCGRWLQLCDVTPLDNDSFHPRDNKQKFIFIASDVIFAYSIQELPITVDIPSSGKTSLRALNLSTRAVNVLTKYGADTVEKALQITPRSLHGIHNCGKVTQAEIVSALNKYTGGKYANT